MDRSDGVPIAPPIVRKAASWMARLCSGSASEEEYTACLQWRTHHPDHERAWQRLAAFDARFEHLPPLVAHGTLVRPELAALQSRRKALRLLGLGVTVSGLGYLVRRSDSWQVAVADYASATGAQREVMLPDGTRVVLNTGSAIDIDFSGNQRLVRLLAGEILVTTAHDPAWIDRPFLVRSHEGTVQALGTRFTVRQDQGRSHVAVYEGVVEIRPQDNRSAFARLNVGQQASFSSNSVMSPGAVEGDAPAWLRGLLVARDMRLADVVAEIARYRHGIVRCTPDVAELRVSGVFSLKDTERALSNLTLGLPLELHYRTRYWVTVTALST